LVKWQALQRFHAILPNGQKFKPKGGLSQANEKVQFLTDPGMTFSTKKKLRTKVLLLGKKP
jgi:hypothetical protein